MTITVAAKPFDPVKYKETTREQWQTAARAWNDWGPSLRAWLGPATELMLDMAKIGPGHRVLDVAAGAGDQTLQTAERVGPTGYVLATDISANILAFAAQNARQAGHRQRRDQGAGRRGSGRAGGHVRRGDLARRPDLFSGSAEGAGRHEAGAQAGRPRCGHRLQHGGEQQVLLDSGLDHPPPRQPAAAAAGPARPLQPRRPRRAWKRPSAGPASATCRAERCRRRCG